MDMGFPEKHGKKTFEICLPYKPPPPQKKRLEMETWENTFAPNLREELFLVGTSLGFMASQPTSPPNIPSPPPKKKTYEPHDQDL